MSLNCDKLTRFPCLSGNEKSGATCCCVNEYLVWGIEPKLHTSPSWTKGWLSFLASSVTLSHFFCPD